MVLGVTGADSTSSDVAGRSGTNGPLWSGALLFLVGATGGSGGVIVSESLSKGFSAFPDFTKLLQIDAFPVKYFAKVSGCLCGVLHGRSTSSPPGAHVSLSCCWDRRFRSITPYKLCHKILFAPRYDARAAGLTHTVSFREL